MSLSRISQSDHATMIGKAEVVPLQVSGTIDTDLSTMTANELMQWGLMNMWNKEEEGAYAVRHSSKPVNDFGCPCGEDASERDENGDRPNYFEKVFPILFPRGRGGIEDDRPVEVTFRDHVRWVL